MEQLRPFRQQLDDRKPPARAFNGIPLSVLREAYHSCAPTRSCGSPRSSAATRTCASGSSAAEWN